MVSRFCIVDVVGVNFIVGWYGFGNCIGCCIYLEKIVCYFLFGIDFGKGVVDVVIKIDF